MAPWVQSLGHEDGGDACPDGPPGLEDSDEAEPDKGSEDTIPAEQKQSPRDQSGGLGRLFSHNGLWVVTRTWPWGQDT